MREIFFRGKRTDNGEWVYGCLIFAPNYNCILQDEEKVHPMDFPYLNGELGVIDGKVTPVDPETVGQYTGLKDKNGTKIFEGDMIKPFDDEIDKMVVEFNFGQFLLCLYGERGYMAEYGWEESGNYGCFEAEPLSSYGDDIEVIGNIHDDPELLGGNNNA